MAKFGEPGYIDGTFMAPCGVAVDSDNEHIYVVDRSQKRIQIFNFTGIIIIIIISSSLAHCAEDNL
jgi:DNA-binding beta-propeller fold protein YncE